MRVRVCIDLDLPFDDEMAFIHQEVFDELINFAITRHLKEALDWHSSSKAISDHHKEWADIMRKANWDINKVEDE